MSLAACPHVFAPLNGTGGYKDKSSRPIEGHLRLFFFHPFFLFLYGRSAPTDSTHFSISLSLMTPSPGICDRFDKVNRSVFKAQQRHFMLQTFFRVVRVYIPNPGGRRKWRSNLYVPYKLSSQNARSSVPVLVCEDCFKPRCLCCCIQPTPKAWLP